MSQKQRFLEAEDAAWQELWRRFILLTPEDWQLPGTSSPWTGKDVLAHLACWHEEAIRYCVALQRGRPDPTWPQNIDAFNAEAYYRCKDLVLPDVLSWSLSARQRFRDQVVLAPETISLKLLDDLAQCAHEHYDEHLPLLDAFLVRSQTEH